VLAKKQLYQTIYNAKDAKMEFREVLISAIKTAGEEGASMTTLMEVMKEHLPTEKPKMKLSANLRLLASLGHIYSREGIFYAMGFGPGPEEPEQEGLVAEEPSLEIEYRSTVIKNLTSLSIQKGKNVTDVAFFGSVRLIFAPMDEEVNVHPTQKVYEEGVVQVAFIWKKEKKEERFRTFVIPDGYKLVIAPVK
jgi:hypothetical protein